MSSDQRFAERLATVEDWVDARSKDFQRMKDDVYSLQKENFDLKRDLFIVQKEKEKLTEKVESMEKTLAVSERRGTSDLLTQQKLESMEKTLAVLERRGTSTVAMITGHDSHNVNDLEARVSSLEKTVPELKVLNKRFMSETEDTKIELSTLSTAITDRVSSLENTVPEWKLMKKRFTSETEGMKTELSTLTSDVKKMNDLEDRVTSLESTVPQLKLMDEVFMSEKEDIIMELSTLSNDFNDVHDLEARVSSLENIVPEMKSTNKRFRSKTKVMKAELATLSTDVKNVVANVDQLSGLRRVLCRTLVAKQDNPELNTMLDNLDARTMDIEGRLDDIAQSVTRVRVNTLTGDLVNDEPARLDECFHVFIGGLYDQTSGCLVPRRDGDYTVGMRFRQIRDGLINMYLNWEGSDGMGQRLAGTSHFDDEACGMCVVRLKKGQKVWLEARRWKGDVTQSATHLLVNTSTVGEELVTGKRIKLNKCTHGYHGGLYHQGSGCLVPRRDGDYRIDVTFKQYGEGVIEMWLSQEGEFHQCLGRTKSQYDVSYGMSVLTLKKGRMVWLEARRETGDANILVCKLYCCLLL